MTGRENFWTGLTRLTGLEKAGNFDGITELFKLKGLFLGERRGKFWMGII
jgi:hypothetical protein